MLRIFTLFFLINITITHTFSQSSQDLKKIKDEFEKSKLNINTGPSLENSTIQDESALPAEATITTFDQINEEIDKSKYFGYDYFSLRDTIKFWENLPTPANYVLGPGDEVVILLWGQTQIRNSFVISREGEIYDDKVGLLLLSGKTIFEAGKYIKEQYGRFYSTLLSENPTSFIDISIGTLKSINVNFIGHMNYPGTYQIHPFSNLVSGLIQSGGIDTTGSLREIVLKRNGEQEIVFDFYDYIKNGSMDYNSQLRDQDIIIIKPRNSFTIIDSAVVRPGIYESKNGESIYDMINHAGGLNHESNGIISLESLQVSKNQLSVQENYSTRSSYISILSAREILTTKKDIIIANKLFYDTEYIEVLGQVKKPGKYNFFEGMSLDDILKLSVGLYDTTFYKSMYTNKIEIVRRNSFKKFDNVYQYNISDLLKNDQLSEIKLENLDKVIIRKNSNFFDNNNIIQISGEIKVPGFYVLTYDAEPLKSIISRAGGFTNRARNEGISIFRRKTNSLIDESIDSELLRVAWSNTDIILMPGDSIVIREKVNTVEVKGSVYNPAIIEFRKNKRLSYYINSAGGIKPNAVKSGIVIMNPNGKVFPKKFLRNPIIKEGSIIIVNELNPEDKRDLSQIFATWSSVASSLLTLAILSQQIQNN